MPWFQKCKTINKQIKKILQTCATTFLSAPDSRSHGFIAQLSVLTQAIMQLIGYQVGNENM